VRVSAATRPLLPLAAVTAGLASNGSLAAEWTFSPLGEIVAQTQQNPHLSSDEDAKHELSNGMGATAALGMERRTERTTITLQPVIRAYRYADNNNLDRDEENLNLSLSWLGEKMSWRAGANAARDTTLTSELGSTGLTQANLQASENRYPDDQTSLENYRYSTALVGASYVVSEKLSLSLFGTVGQLDGEGHQENTANSSASVQASYVWSPVSSVSASIGQSWSKTGDQRQRGLLYNVSATRAFEKGSLAFSVGRRQSPSGRALLTEADEANLAFSTQITERLSATAQASYTKRRNVLRQFDIDLERVRYTRTDLGLSWRMTSSWKLGLNVGAAIQQIGSGFVADELTGRGYDVRLGFGWNGDPYVK
jgi:hypothetical protein